MREEGRDWKTGPSGDDVNPWLKGVVALGSHGSHGGWRRGGRGLGGGLFLLVPLLGDLVVLRLTLGHACPGWVLHGSC